MRTKQEILNYIERREAEIMNNYNVTLNDRARMIRIGRLDMLEELKLYVMGFEPNKGEHGDAG